MSKCVFFPVKYRFNYFFNDDHIIASIVLKLVQQFLKKFKSEGIFVTSDLILTGITWLFWFTIIKSYLRRALHISIKVSFIPSTKIPAVSLDCLHPIFFRHLKTLKRCFTLSGILTKS